MINQCSCFICFSFCISQLPDVTARSARYFTSIYDFSNISGFCTLSKLAECKKVVRPVVGLGWAVSCDSEEAAATTGSLPRGIDLCITVNTGFGETWTIWQLWKFLSGTIQAVMCFQIRSSFFREVSGSRVKHCSSKLCSFISFYVISISFSLVPNFEETFFSSHLFSSQKLGFWKELKVILGGW